MSKKKNVTNEPEAVEYYRIEIIKIIYSLPLFYLAKVYNFADSMHQKAKGV